MSFKVGDIIFQKRDKITFTIVEKKGNKLVLEYYDTHTMSIRNITMNKNQLFLQFKDRPEDLEHFKVILK
jgi:hypothetical protein